VFERVVWISLFVSSKFVGAFSFVQYIRILYEVDLVMAVCCMLRMLLPMPPPHRRSLCAPNAVLLVALPGVACVRLLLVLHSSDRSLKVLMKWQRELDPP